MLPTIFVDFTDDLEREEFDYYFLNSSSYYCGNIEPHEPHDDEGTYAGRYEVHTCNGDPEYNFPIEKECGS